MEMIFTPRSFAAAAASQVSFVLPVSENTTSALSADMAEAVSICMCPSSIAWEDFPMRRKLFSPMRAAIPLTEMPKK